jgi:hypothetical protein
MNKLKMTASRNHILAALLLVLISVCLPEKVACAAETRNLLNNPSFEVGTDGWRIEDAWTTEGESSITESTNAFSGKKIVEFKLHLSGKSYPPGLYLGITSAWLPVKQGEATFSVYARATQGKPNLTLRFVDSDEEKTWALTPEWKRYYFSAVLKLQEPSESGSIQITGDGEAQIDAAQFELGKLTDYQEPTESLLGLESKARTSLLYPEEQTEIGFNVCVPKGYENSKNLTVSWTWGDQEKKVIGEKEIPVHIEAGNTFSYKEPWQTKETGLYHWEAKLKSNGKELEKRTYSLGVVPKQEPYTAGKYNMFGECMGPWNVRIAIDRIQRLGVSIVRFIPLLSPVPEIQAIQKDPNHIEWQWDSLINYVNQHGLSQFLTIIKAGPSKEIQIKFKNPEWRNSYHDYLKLLAEHYKDKVQAFEVWNEPATKTDPKTYAAIHKATAEGLKAGDPQAYVVSGSAVPAHGIWIKDILDQGLGQNFNALSVHSYLREVPEREFPRVRENMLGHDESVLKATGIGDMPIWDTESGYMSMDSQVHSQEKPPPSFFKTLEEQAQFNIRQELLSLAFGIRVKADFIIAPGHHCHSPFWGDSMESARPSVVAYGVLTSILRDAELINSYASSNDGTCLMNFGLPSSKQWLWVLWNRTSNQVVTINTPSPVSVKDMYGREMKTISKGTSWTIPVGASPCYLFFSENIPDLQAKTTLPSGKLNFGQLTEVLTQNLPVQKKEQRLAGLPVEPTIVLQAKDVSYSNWNPGLVEVKNALSPKILALQHPSNTPPLVKFTHNFTNEEAGRYQIWARTAPIATIQNTPLAVQLDDTPPMIIVGTDSPEIEDVTLSDGKTAGIAWDNFGMIEVASGVHTFTFISSNKKGPDVWNQYLDTVVLSKKKIFAGEKKKKKNE